MIFKFVALFALLAAVNAGVVSHVTYATTPVVQYVNPAEDAVVSTRQSVVRSFGGSVSSYSKAIDTPYSSVRKMDTRLNNNVYSPAVAKTVMYAAPVATKAVVTPTAYAHAHAHAHYPTIAKTVSYSAIPNGAKTIVRPAFYPHSVPSYHAFAKTTGYNHGPDASSYSHSSPGVSAYGTSQTVHYSPAEMVSHMSFDGFGTHWGF